MVRVWKCQAGALTQQQVPNTDGEKQGSFGVPQSPRFQPTRRHRLQHIHQLAPSGCRVNTLV